MDLATLNVTQKKKNSNNDVVLQITKNQLSTIIMVLAAIVFSGFTLLAINLESPFIQELLISEIIILMILFIKSSNSNKIKK